MVAEEEAPATRLAQEALARDRIVEHLKRTGTDSISGIARMLSERREAPLHRLTVAGYLQALFDLGVLKELDRPPSKLYQLSSPEAHRTLHQRAWRQIEEMNRSEEDKVRLLVAALQTLLGRPVFHAELLHAGVPRVPDALAKVVVPDEVRRAYRRLFERKASPRIDVPQRDPLYGLPPGDPILGHSQVGDVVRRALVKASGAEHLVADRTGAAGAQRALDLEGPT
ncbi:MAG TPA: hypothetical protein VI796_05250 [Candidatus Thermoplasmatota archaeon]|nr:hypothetical protein [Candidatus Thermoplasmatota archaeon]